jgi:hypothetical protein
MTEGPLVYIQHIHCRTVVVMLGQSGEVEEKMAVTHVG